MEGSEALLSSAIFRLFSALVIGFIAGYVAVYFSINPAFSGFNPIACSMAGVCAAVNAARQLFISKEQNKKDRNIFLCWGLAAGAIVLGLSGYQTESAITAVFIGCLGVFVNRKYNGSWINEFEKRFAKGAFAGGFLGYILTTGVSIAAAAALAGGCIAGVLAVYRAGKLNGQN